MSGERTREIQEEAKRELGQKKCLTHKLKTSGDRFTKVIVNRKSKITLKISLRARIRAFH